MPSIDINITLTTTDVTEGSNLYYTQARFDTAFAAKSTTNLSEGSNLYFTDERAQDAVGTILTNSTTITFTYDDSGNTITAIVKPDLTLNTLSINANSGQIVLDADDGSGFTTTLQDSASASAKTITFPNVTGTLASLANLNQTFAGVMSFSNTIKANNTSKPLDLIDSTGLIYASILVPSIAGAISVTLPNATTTLAGLSVAQTFSALKTFTAGIILNTAGSLTITDLNIVLGTTTGTKFGTATSQKLGFWNVTPIIQPASANQAALTDSTTGTPGFTLVDTGIVFSQANINNNFASLNRQVDSFRTALVNSGIIKGAA